MYIYFFIFYSYICNYHHKRIQTQDYHHNHNSFLFVNVLLYFSIEYFNIKINICENAKSVKRVFEPCCRLISATCSSVAQLLPHVLDGELDQTLVLLKGFKMRCKVLKHHIATWRQLRQCCVRYR